MALPFLVVGAVVAGITGLAKGAKAHSDLNEAKKIGKNAHEDYKEAKKSLNKIKRTTNKKLEKLGELKLNIFTNQIKYTIDVIKKTKDAGSTLEDFESTITLNELKKMETMVTKSLEIENGLTSGAAGGILAGLGAVGGVKAFAAASTGTAISSLSGAASVNATLAWLGGGSLTTGGLGMAGGMAVLGGVVAGPALAIGGFILASKAEKALTEAKEYEAEVEDAILEMELLETSLEGIQMNIDEMTHALKEMVERFEKIKVDDMSDKESFQNMIVCTKVLKEMIDCKIIKDDGSPIKNIKQKCKGFLKI